MFFAWPLSVLSSNRIFLGKSSFPQYYYTRFRDHIGAPTPITWELIWPCYNQTTPNHLAVVIGLRGTWSGLIKCNSILELFGNVERRENSLSFHEFGAVLVDLSLSCWGRIMWRKSAWKWNQHKGKQSQKRLVNDDILWVFEAQEVLEAA